MPLNPHDSPNGGSPPSPSKPKEKFLSLILKAIIMMFLISFFFLLLPLASFLLLLLLPLLLRHQRHGDVCHSHPSSGFSPKQLKMLPQFRFSQETKPTHLEFDSCVICLDGFGRGQLCRNLVGCGHLFHRKCLDAWLMKVAACPICRTRVCLDNEDNGIWGFGTRRTDFQGLLDLRRKQA
ncbi:RING-H2 finger protein ATL56-like [Durio zibethinus]|uniref:RING-type E3 ubiquitin transferase n=1 Tax=Durio zibethinus TaxID=66656 RepID=A0A6P5Z9K7_DURZI|nr:RING-H2 finger protein ATL56-like [Durio zibethinus]